jgi:hypothetical protein
MTGDYSLKINITQRLVFSVMVFTALIGNVFQRWAVDVPLLLGSRSHRLVAISHQPPTLLPSQDYIVMAASPHYIASGAPHRKQHFQQFKLFVLFKGSLFR